VKRETLSGTLSTCRVRSAKFIFIAFIWETSFFKKLGSNILRKRHICAKLSNFLRESSTTNSPFSQHCWNDNLRSTPRITCMYHVIEAVNHDTLIQWNCRKMTSFMKGDYFWPRNIPVGFSTFYLSVFFFSSRKNGQFKICAAHNLSSLLIQVIPAAKVIPGNSV